MPPNKIDTEHFTSPLHDKKSLLKSYKRNFEKIIKYE